MTAPPANQPSSLLESDENTLVYSLLGRNRSTIATTVAQIYFSELAGAWTYKATGVICFVRDANVRTFSLRFYDLEQRRLLFEQEIYINMHYMSHFSYFHQVEADKQVVGFNFVDNEAGRAEALELAQVLKAKVDKLTNRVNGVSPKMEKLQQLPVPPEPAPSSKSSRPQKLAGKLKDKLKAKVKGTHQKKDQVQPRRLDIGAPVDFRHVMHISPAELAAGMGPVGSDPVLKFLFSKIGQDLEKTLKTKLGQKNLEAFIDQQGGLDKIHESASLGRFGVPGHKPMPSTPYQVSPQAPIRQSPSPPKPAQMNRRGAPPPPPPRNLPPPSPPRNRIPPAPPPPPPPVLATQPLSPKSQTTPASGSTSRPADGKNDVLSDIRNFQRGQLKPTSARPGAPTNARASEKDMCSALKAALGQVHRANYGNNDDENDDDDDEEWA